MTNDAPVHIIGGGIAGLVAAITAAEAGATVVLYEAGPELGGRARSGAGPYGVNLGPHVVYRGGALTHFLRDRGLDRDVVLHMPPARGFRLVDEHGTHGPLTMLGGFAAMQLKREAPVDVDFATWATRSFGRRVGTQLGHLGGLSTFHHDPGSLAADFVWQRCRRTLGRPDTVRYIGGGWGSLVSTLERAARNRGVRIELDSPVDALPDGGPVIVAVPAGTAGHLLDTTVTWPTARTALLDVALEGPGNLAAIVLDTSDDLRGCVLAERCTAVDRSLAPAGIELVQAQLGIDDHTTLDDAVARMEQTLDNLGSWRLHEIWRRALVVQGATGAVDPVGTTWRDRPPIDQGDGRYLAGDAVAAPGLLSEVSVNSGVRAAHLALAERHHRQWAPGWPTVQLTASTRAQVLAATLPGATIRTRHLAAPLEAAWKPEPAHEVEPYRIRTRRLGTARITAAESAPSGGTTVTTVTVPRRR